MVSSGVSAFALGLVLSAVQEWIKREPWVPLWPRYSGQFNRVMSVIGAVSAVFGISYQYDGLAKTLTISGLDLTQALTLGAGMAIAWVGSQLGYHGIIKRVF